LLFNIEGMTGLERVSFFRRPGEQHLDLPEDAVTVGG
jgi:hypothetical protein